MILKPEAGYHTQMAEQNAGVWGETTESGGDALPGHRLVGLQTEGGPFSALDLRDRVVIMLLFDQVVREEQVELAWQLWHQMNQGNAAEPLWRVLTLFPDLDRDLVYAEASRVYGFGEARIKRKRALPLIHELAARLPSSAWDELIALRTVPIDVDQEGRIHLATHDPTCPELHRLLPNLNFDGYVIQYAREQDILNLLVEAFPQRYSHLKELSGLSKDLLMKSSEGQSEDESAVFLSLFSSSTLGSPEEESQATLQLFDEVLAEALHNQATDVCLLPGLLGGTEVYLQIGEELRSQRVIEEPAPERLREIIKRNVIHAEACTGGRIRQRLVERTIDGRIVRFKVALVPPSDEVQAECVVVHVLG